MECMESNKVSCFLFDHKAELGRKVDMAARDGDAPSTISVIVTTTPMQ